MQIHQTGDSVLVAKLLEKSTELSLPLVGRIVTEGVAAGVLVHPSRRMLPRAYYAAGIRRCFMCLQHLTTNNPAIGSEVEVLNPLRRG